MSNNDHETPSTETKGHVSKSPETPKTIKEAAKALFKLGMWILSTLHLLQFFATMVKRLIAFLREMSDAS